MPGSDSDRLQSLLAAEPFITHTDLSDVIAPIIRFGRELDRAECRVTLFGAAKTGKSSLLNGLIGVPLLATRAFRTNRAITEVRYGPIPQVTVARSEGVEQVALDRARGLLAELESLSGDSPIEVGVSVPLPLLVQGMVLVDTPGLLTDAGLDESVRDHIMRADLAVMVLAADKALSVEERAIAAWANSLLRGNLVFVINRMDLIDADDRTDVMEWVKAALRDTGNADVGEPRIFATSTPARPPGRLILSNLEEWLRALNQPAKQDGGHDSQTRHEVAYSKRLCQQSRLGVLEQQIASATVQFRAHHTNAVERTRDLTNEHFEGVMLERSTRRQAIARARRAMEGVQDKLTAIGEAFVRDTVSATRKKLTPIAGSETIHLDLDGSLMTYSRAVNDIVLAPVVNSLAPAVDEGASPSDTIWSDGLIRPFDLSRLIFRMDVEPAVDPASRVAVDLGDLLTRVVDGGRSGREAGAAIGGWIGKNVLGEDTEVETVKRIEGLSREVLNTVLAETQRYLAEVNGSLERADAECGTWMPASIEVEKAESAERELAAALQWTDGLMLAVRVAGQEADLGQP